MTRPSGDTSARTSALLSASQGLPITGALTEIRQTLAEQDTLLLEAPPGAGKTTIVPLALLDEPWLRERSIIMLQPRRLAARNAAARMADLLGEKTGDTVGYRVRLDSRVGANTRIEVVTEGVLLRMLTEDPALETVGLLIFDEFHERSLDSDLGLALALHGRRTFAENDAAKIIVMSATLGDDALDHYLGAPRLRCEGRQFPVTTHYSGARKPRERTDERVVKALDEAVSRHPDSSVLVFLPGRGEINRVAGQFQPPAGCTVHPLYGDLDLRAQREAIAPSPRGTRKVVLATNIAETSLTIEGVDVVIDAGLERRPRFDPGSAMSRLYTQPISRASATQRAGRAGRLRPGHCYRLWSESQHQSLAAERTAEIETADLAPLALQLFAWGIYDPDEIAWLTPPAPGPFAQAMGLLARLGAVEGKPGKLRLTRHGDAMAGLAVHPRLAHLLLAGQTVGAETPASLIAAALSEGLPRQAESADLAFYLDLLRGERPAGGSLQSWTRRTREVARQLRGQLPRAATARIARPDEGQLPGYLLACAYPDRVARRRHSGGYQLSNGRSVGFAQACSLQREKWLAVADVGGLGGKGSDTIRAATALDPGLFDNLLAPLIREHVHTGWDEKTGLFTAERQRRCGALRLTSERLTQVPGELRIQGLITLLAESRLTLLPWSEEAERFRARAALMATLEPDWPPFDIAALIASLDDWLGLYLEPVKRLKDLKSLALPEALKARLSYDKLKQLERELPERISVPSGAQHRIDYAQDPPVLAVKLQEMFGCRESPTLAGGRVPLLIHLLSPAGRPLQVTRDLASFWDGSYAEVRREMKGRYPKHPWPDDPLAARATALTKKRLTQSRSS